MFPGVRSASLLQQYVPQRNQRFRMIRLYLQRFFGIEACFPKVSLPGAGFAHSGQSDWVVRIMAQRFLQNPDECGRFRTPHLCYIRLQPEIAWLGRIARHHISAMFFRSFQLAMGQISVSHRKMSHFETRFQRECNLRFVFACMNAFLIHQAQTQKRMSRGMFGVSCQCMPERCHRIKMITDPHLLNCALYLPVSLAQH